MSRIAFIVFCGLFSLQISGQERMSISKMLALRSPSSEKVYWTIDESKQGEWRYDPEDKDTPPNVGTILRSTRRDVTGRFKRVYDRAEGVNLDWFMTSNNAPINEALGLALHISEKVIFSSKTYLLAPLKIEHRERVHFHFQNTTLQAQAGLKQAKVWHLENIRQLWLTGQVTLDGNTSKQNIKNPQKEMGEAFLHIVAPSKGGVGSLLQIGSLTFRNMPMCGVNVFVANDITDTGYDRICVRAFREINGYNGLNVQQDNFVAWGVNVRGAHRSVVIDSLYAQQDAQPWGDAPIEKSFYTFTFENQVDARIHPRKDSLYIKTLYAQYPCSMILYTQAPNHVLIDNVVMVGALRKPQKSDALAYPTMLRQNISWIGSKHTWTSYQSPKSSFRVKKLLIKDTNPLFMNLSSINDITGLWLNKGITGAVFDYVETDVRLKFYGDGHYFGFSNVPDGAHQVGKWVSRIPAKRNYVQPLNADLSIDTLHLAKGAGVTFAMGNARVGMLTQEEGTQAVFENRDNRFKESSQMYNGFVVEACRATNILWRFNWNINEQALTNDNNIKTGERYQFRNFTGNNLLQTHTTVSTANGISTYVSAFKLDADPNIKRTVERFVQFVEFDWRNVTMKLADTSPSDLTRRYFTSSSQPQLLYPTPKRARMSSRGWSKEWQGSRFEQCQILP